MANSPRRGIRFRERGNIVLSLFAVVVVFIAAVADRHVQGKKYGRTPDSPRRNITRLIREWGVEGRGAKKSIPRSNLPSFSGISSSIHPPHLPFAHLRGDEDYKVCGMGEGRGGV